MRHPLTAAQRAARDAALASAVVAPREVDAFAPPPEGAQRTRKEKPRKFTQKQMDTGIERTLAMLKSSERLSMKGRELAYLYAWLHRTTYGVEAQELLADMGKASAAAGNMLRHQFGGNVDRALAFLRWTWAREKAQVAKRANDFRIGWRYQFGSGALMTDYRIALSRKGKIQ